VPVAQANLDISYPDGASHQDCVSRANVTEQHFLHLFPGLGDGPPGLPLLVAPLAERQVDCVWFGFHTLLSDQGRVEIVEWDAKAAPTPTGKSITVKGA
jgi:hypothetical protein